MVDFIELKLLRGEGAEGKGRNREKPIYIYKRDKREFKEGRDIYNKSKNPKTI